MSVLPMMSGNPFIDKEPYTPDVDPINSYINASANFIQHTHNISHDESIEVMINLVKKKRKDPYVTIYKRKDNGDRFKTVMRLTQYIREAYKLNETLVPSLTRYSPSEEDNGIDSLHKAFTTYNLSARAKAKKAAATAYSNGDMWLASELTNKQKVLKLLNNAMSGAFASPGTIHYNPSAHYTLTSITRSTASIGNIITEQVSAGNRFYSTLDNTLGHLVSTVTCVPDSKYVLLLEKFDIHVPTVDECIEMVHWSSDLYWKDADWTNTIRTYINGLSDIERCKIVYNNDLFHFHKFNRNFARTMILALGGKANGIITTEEQVSYVEAQPDYLKSLVIHVCMEEMLAHLGTTDPDGKGITLNPKELYDTPLLDLISSTLYNMVNKFSYYTPVLNALFANRIHPVGMANTKEMVRRVIALSDTDSTCGSYGHWVIDILGGEDFGQVGVSVSSTIMTIVGLSIENAINVFTGNMNVGSKSQGLLEMKNEYFWKTFSVGNATKHYYALVNIVEGLVLKEPKLELKGSGFILSKTSKIYRDISDELFMDINNKVADGIKINPREYIDRVLKVEKMIMEKVTKGDMDILESTTIKGEKSYKKPMSSAYQHYKLWDEIFAEKYGHVDEPPYIAVKYNCNIGKKSELKLFLDGIKDDKVRSRFKTYMEKNNKDKITNILLPFDKVLEAGIPEEIVDIVDMSKLVRGNCKAMYRILQSIGVVVKEDFTLHEMGYTLDDPELDA